MGRPLFEAGARNDAGLRRWEQGACRVADPVKGNGLLGLAQIYGAMPEN
jgi:hypothetical protein